jgi:selenocysteine lyase/cysteine desulfurase
MSGAGFKLTRRRMLAALPVLPALPAATLASAAAPAPSGAFPRKAAFDIEGINLNAAYTHPMSNATVQAMRDYLDGRQLNVRGKSQNLMADRNESRDLFARMINADPGELAWVASTMAGENYIVNGLGLGQPGTRGRVVTDAYHFDGSLYLYGELAKQGLDVHVVRPKNNGIDLADMEAAITPGTTLVAVSLVSTINGFQHDLKALCKIAHARGALVYADIIQAAGAVPIDVKDTGVDFCACSTYKWLMGDFGVGLLYVRKESLARIRRTVFGYRQLAAFDFHVFPFDPPGKDVFDFATSAGTAGRFEVGTLGNGAVAGLRASLRMLTETGVERIQAWRQPLLQRLQQDMPRLGFAPMTRPDSTAPIVSFAYRDAARKLRPRLDKAGINIQLYEHRVRISPSFYNDMGDIERLLAALA